MSDDEVESWPGAPFEAGRRDRFYWYCEVPTKFPRMLAVHWEEGNPLDMPIRFGCGGAWGSASSLPNPISSRVHKTYTIRAEFIGFQRKLGDDRKGHENRQLRERL